MGSHDWDPLSNEFERVSARADPLLEWLNENGAAAKLKKIAKSKNTTLWSDCVFRFSFSPTTELFS